MVAARDRLLAFVCLLQPLGAGAGIHDPPAALSETRTRSSCGVMPPQAASCAGNGGLPSLPTTTRRKRELTMDYSRRELRRVRPMAFVPGVPRASGTSPFWKRRRRRLASSAPFQQQKQQHRPDVAPDTPVRRHLESRQRPQRYRPVASMAKTVEDNEDPSPTPLSFSPPQRQQQQPLGDETVREGFDRPEVPKWRHKAVIIPGFATDARAFEQLCHRLERRGIASVVVPIRWYHWLATLGGRSVRPILDRVHETVIRCVVAKEHKDMPYAFNEPGLQQEVAPYTAEDFLAEMREPKNGAHHMGPLNLPFLPAAPSTDERVVLIAHSAGGWMSRIYLSEASYDGRVYNASSAVNGLVTLGTPHVRLTDDEGRPRDLPFSRNFKFVEDFCTGQKGGDWEKKTPTICVGGAALQGRSSFGGLVQDLVYQSYELCCGDGSGIGDGITPLESAFDMAGARRYVELEGVVHASGLGGPWYGSDSVIDSWLEPSLDTIFGPRAEDDVALDVFKRGSHAAKKAVPCTVRDRHRVGKDAA